MSNSLRFLGLAVFAWAGVRAASLGLYPGSTSVAPSAKLAATLPPSRRLSSSRRHRPIRCRNPAIIRRRPAMARLTPVPIRHPTPWLTRPTRRSSGRSSFRQAGPPESLPRPSAAVGAGQA